MKMAVSTGEFCWLLSIFHCIYAVYVHKTYVIDGHLRLSWKESMAKCRESGMELVSIESKEENDLIKNMIEPSQSFDGEKVAEIDYWTSGVLSANNVWHWASSGKPLVYTDWAVGSPSDRTGQERCLRIWGHHHLQWDDFLCSARLHYICQRNLLTQPQKKTPQISPTTLSLTTVTSTRMTTVTPKSTFPMRMSTNLTTSSCSTSGISMSTLLDEDSYWLTVHQLSFVIFRSEKLRWLEAREFCNKLGMDLAALANDNERYRLVLFLREKKLEQSCYWLREMEAGGEWRSDSRVLLHEDYHGRALAGKRRVEGGEQVQLVRRPREAVRPRSAKCLLLIPSSNALQLRECWIRCAFVCEKIDDFPA